MFIIATNDRESYAYAGVVIADTATSAREKFIQAWSDIYDTSTVILLKVEPDLSTTTVFYADTDGQAWVDENTLEIHEEALSQLDAALTPYAEL